MTSPRFAPPGWPTEFADRFILRRMATRNATRRASERYDDAKRHQARRGAAGVEGCGGRGGVVSR